MSKKDIFQYILGSLIVSGFFGLLYLLVMSEVPAANSDLLNLVTGALIGSFASVVGYYFGSSSSSKAKDETINNVLLSKPADTNNAPDKPCP